jgi:tetratricopeptide (TPR) repeat protein
MIYYTEQRFKKSSTLSPIAIEAKQYIQWFEQLKKPNPEEQTLAAAAYYTLAVEPETSYSRSKINLNITITLLQTLKLEDRALNWPSDIAHAYYKRAELFEQKNNLESAAQDYLRAIQVLNPIVDTDRILLAQSAISLADLLVFEKKFFHKNPTRDIFDEALTYINQALEQMDRLTNVEDDHWATYAYAHQVAGMALGIDHFEEAQEALRLALFMAFKTETFHVYPLLSDIYYCLGLLYERRYDSCPFEIISQDLLDYSNLYFGLSLLFSPEAKQEDIEEGLTLESLFEMIYRVLDPHLPRISYQGICDLIDALIHAYMCIVDQSLPNQTLKEQLNEPEAFDAFVQHVYCLLREVLRAKNPAAGLLEIIDLTVVDRCLRSENILIFLESRKLKNVYYLEDMLSSKSPQKQPSFTVV